MINVAGIERRLDLLIAEMQSVKSLLRELIDSQPHCTCYGRKEGETWTCEIHGIVTRTKVAV